MEQARIVLTTVSSKDEAEKLARSLVEARLAACVNILSGICSVYRWQGAVEESDEVQLIMKTTAEKLKALETAVRTLHSYAVPEFLVLPVENSGNDYLAWLHESVE